MSRTAWYKLPDRLEPGVVVGHYQEYEYSGGPASVPPEVNHAVISFSGDTATDNFIAYSKAVSEDFETKKRVYALNLQHVALNKDTLLALASLTPVKYLDLRGHALTPKELLSIYRRVGSHCQILLDDKHELLSWDNSDPPTKTQFKLPVDSFKREHVVLSDFMSFLHRINLVDGDIDLYLTDFITDLDFRKTYIYMDKFINGGVDLMPPNVRHLRVAYVPAENFDGVLWSQVPKLTELDIGNCGFDFSEKGDLAAFLADIPNLRSLRNEGNTTTFVPFMQLVASVEHLATNSAADLVPQLALKETTYDQLVAFAFKYTELIRSQMVQPATAVAESKADEDGPTEQERIHAESFVAIGEYLRLANAHCYPGKQVTYGELQRKLKKVHMPGVYYRNLPAENFVDVPGAILSDIRQLFPKIKLWQGHDGAILVRDLLAAHSILLSPFIEKNATDLSTLFEGPISVSRLDELFVKISKEQPIVEKAYLYYQKNNIDHMAKFRHIEQIRNGMNLIMGACMSMRTRAQKDAIVGEATMEFTAEDALAMLKYREQFLAPAEVVEPEEAVAAAAVPAVLASSAALFGGAQATNGAGARVVEAKDNEGEEADSDASSDAGFDPSKGYDMRPLVGSATDTGYLPVP
ncbi:MAG: hypothetical protein P1U40_07515 [Coxiellaceae bacterium]|nr:hypothetical protein [Coxiellaceae bacterium]